MKPGSNQTQTEIMLSKTFFNVAAGEVSASDVAARAEAARKGCYVERTDPFIGNYGR